jgi:hypothetical protein
MRVTHEDMTGQSDYQGIPPLKLNHTYIYIRQARRPKRLFIRPKEKRSNAWLNLGMPVGPA